MKYQYTVQYDRASEKKMECEIEYLSSAQFSQFSQFLVRNLNNLSWYWFDYNVSIVAFIWFLLTTVLQILLKLEHLGQSYSGVQTCVNRLVMGNVT